MSESLRAILRAAERLTVGTIAQEPYCAEADTPLYEIYDHARREGFDWLPVKHHGATSKIIQREQMASVETFEQLLDAARDIGLDEIVSRDAPLYSILHRVSERKPLLCLGRESIDGIVTPYDFNQPAGQHFGFSLALVIETAIGNAITGEADDHGLDDDELAEQAFAADIATNELRRWRERSSDAEQIRLVASLGLTDKIDLLKTTRFGLGRLVDCVRGAGDPAAAEARLLRDLIEIRELRNDIAYQRMAFQDHRRSCRRLRLAYDLARTLIA